MPEFDIGSPEWRYWIVNKINELELGDIRDETIATFIANTNSDTWKAIEHIVESANTAVTVELSRLITETVTTAGNQANKYARLQDESVLRQAKEYTDQHNSGGGSGGVSQLYVDEADKNTLSKANEHSDSVGQSAVTSAKTYANDEISKLDKTLRDAFKAADAEVLRQAKGYADSLGGDGSGGGGVTPEQLANAVAQGVTDANTYTGRELGELDGRLSDAIDAAATKTLADATAGAESIAREALSGANGTAQEYANTAESNSNTYTDTAIDTFADNIAAFIDGKIAVDDSGWVACNFAGFSQDTAFIRKRGNDVRMRGFVSATSGVITNQVFGVLNYFPIDASVFVCATDNMDSAKFDIDISGNASFAAVDAAIVYLDGIVFWTD
jgi:hypothetical protein